MTEDEAFEIARRADEAGFFVDCYVEYLQEIKRDQDACTERLRRYHDRVEARLSDLFDVKDPVGGSPSLRAAVTLKLFGRRCWPGEPADQD